MRSAAVYQRFVKEALRHKHRGQSSLLPECLELRLAALGALCELEDVHVAIRACTARHLCAWGSGLLAVALALATLGALAKLPRVRAALGAGATGRLTSACSRGLRRRSRKAGSSALFHEVGLAQQAASS